MKIIPKKKVLLELDAYSQLQIEYLKEICANWNEDESRYDLGTQVGIIRYAIDSFFTSVNDSLSDESKDYLNKVYDITYPRPKSIINPLDEIESFKPSKDKVLSDTKKEEWLASLDEE